MVLLLKEVYGWMKSGDDRRRQRRQQDIENYLAQSVDRYDLERRERELDRKRMW